MSEASPHKPILFCLDDHKTLFTGLARQLDWQQGELQVRRFPDGESYVRLLSEVRGRRVVLLCSLNHPDKKFLPLLFTAQTARELGAESVGLVAPYLGYMRQDKRFHEGEAITSRHFARVLSQQIDWLLTVDPHLHRYRRLEEIYGVPSRALHAAPYIARWIKQEVDMPLLIGPDEESAQWVSTVASQIGAPSTVLEKTRYGDKNVSVSVPEVERWQTHTPVLVDDIISTAHTMIETVGHLKKCLPNPPLCIGIHAVFAGDAYRELQHAGAGRIATCNSIPHVTNQIDLAPLLVGALDKKGYPE